MTLPPLHLAALLAAVLLAGWLLGRRSYRRKLQTTEGRQRAGTWHGFENCQEWGDEAWDEPEVPATAPLASLADRVRTRELRAVRP